MTACLSGGSRHASSGFALLSAIFLLMAASPASGANLVLNATGGHIVAAEVNGVPLRLKVDLDHSSGVTLNPSAAERAGLGRGEGRWVQVIGPVKLRGRFSETRLMVAGQTFSAKVRWFDREVAAGADGTITPHLLPFENVTLQLRPTSGAERESTLATKFHDNHGIHVPVRIGRYRIAARFAPDRPRTTAPAAAAAVLGLSHNGFLEENGSTEEIDAGIRRPVWPLRLEQPLRIGQFEISVLMARTSDWRGDHHLPPTQASADARELVVTGERPSQDALYRITIGQDVLHRCSSVTYSRPAARLTFRCRPE